jgi:urease accessory protein
MRGNTMINRALSTVSAAAAIAVVSSPALAHHPLGGMPMQTFAHGLLSGVGHPILGFDHLFFVALVGIAAVFTAHRFVAPLAYIGAMLVGCLLMSFGIQLPLIEVAIALSLLALGALVMSGRRFSTNCALIAFAFAGLFHGSAFGESILGQEGGAPAVVLVGYLVGLAITQYVIALASGFALTAVWDAREASAVPARISGAVVAGVGLFMTLEIAEGLVFSAFGISA